MIKSILSQLPHTRLTLSAKTTLLHEGSISTKIYLIESGCIRLWFNNDGKDVTLQFFMQGQVVSSFESFINNQPSRFTLETVLPSEVIVYEKRDFDHFIESNDQLYGKFSTVAFDIASKYVSLFLSRITDSPQQRYEKFLSEHPDIVAQIPQHYIATFLGITPVSLSRIRARLLKS